VQGGYNYVLPSRFLLGVEADMSFLNWLAADDVAWTRTTPDTDIAEKIDYMATLRGRLGYAFDHWMVYATGGFAWSLGRFLQTPGAVGAPRPMKMGTIASCRYDTGARSALQSTKLRLPAPR